MKLEILFFIQANILKFLGPAHYMLVFNLHKECLLENCLGSVGMETQTNVTWASSHVFLIYVVLTRPFYFLRVYTHLYLALWFCTLLSWEVIDFSIISNFFNVKICVEHLSSLCVCNWKIFWHVPSEMSLVESLV